MKLKYAFAVNQFNDFEPKHFGDADKFIIYEWVDHELKLVQEQPNIFKDMDEGQTHGLPKKGEAVINLFKGLNINVLVSKQFGKNIQMINRYFIPVIVPEVSMEEAIQIITKHKKWIEDEHRNRPAEFKLFIIKNGILKTKIKKDV